MVLSVSSIRSDSLSALRPLVASNAMLQMFDGIFQTTLIVDANIIMGDILWLAFKRKNSAARSEFRELLDAKTVLAIAPTYLEEEMKSNLLRLAAQKKVKLESLEIHWAEYRALITFLDMGGPDDSYDDPKDAPYIKLQRHSGHLIYSRDSDITRMGGQVASAVLIASMRMYSRRVVVEYTLKIGGTGTLYVSLETVAAIGRLLREIVPSARALPRWVWWAALLTIACALLYRPSRQYLFNIVQALPAKSKGLATRAFDQLASFIAEHETAKREADAAVAAVRGEVSIARADKCQ
jgi:predicted nucleic acid-binding protein